MSRAAVEARIHDRTARSRLTARKRPYWRLLSEGVFLGYYRGAIKGSWIARFYLGTGEGYVTSQLGEADDRCPANGETILDFKQAFDAALRWVELTRLGGKRTDLAGVSHPGITVAEAVDVYIAARDARRASQAGSAVRSDAHYKMTRYVLQDAIAQIALARLTEADLRAWQLRIHRTKASSIQRVINDFKAALNAAFVLHRRILPSDFPLVVKYGLTLEAPEMLISTARDNQVLSDDQMRRVVAAALAIDEDFGRLVVLLAATGARFSQLARMKVGDVQADKSRLMVPQSFKGRKRSLQHIRVPVGADTLAALAPATSGRPASAALLEHWRMTQTGPLVWEKSYRGPWTSPSAMLRPWQRAVEAAGLPASTIPYALRHSSIVRGLRAGLPIRLVAALHDTSVAMIERHYARWITEGLDDLVAKAVVPILAHAA